MVARDRVKHTLPQVLEAIKDSHGIKIAIARKLGCHRNSVENYLKRYAQAQEAYDEEVAKIGDLAETVIIRSILANDVETAKWYASVKVKGYGDVTKHEVAGANGGDIKIRVVYGDEGKEP